MAYCKKCNNKISSNEEQSNNGYCSNCKHNSNNINFLTQLGEHSGLVTYSLCATFVLYLLAFQRHFEIGAGGRLIMLLLMMVPFVFFPIYLFRDTISFVGEYHIIDEEKDNDLPRKKRLTKEEKKGIVLLVGIIILIVIIIMGCINTNSYIYDTKDDSSSIYTKYHKCEYPGCSNYASETKYCSKHNQTKCSKPGCSNKEAYQGAGLCRTHLYQSIQDY